MNIAIFASGKGSNAKNIIEYFQGKDLKFFIFTNNEESGVIDIAWQLDVNCIIFNKYENLLKILQSNSIEFIALAGYLKLIPLEVISFYKNKIVNIHPSLLPKYGGKGMWGMNVHKSVIQNKEKESGITIHYVSERYDEGEIIEQRKCEITDDDTPQMLYDKIHRLELNHYPKCIENLIFL
jgi:phosphoribosylglycinamide formyltransferase-1